jgi:mono/diheme cytochrome c family protein
MHTGRQDTKSLHRRWHSLAAAVPFGFVLWGAPALAAEGDSGKAILEHNCGRCHAVETEAKSPLKQAPNLFVVLGSYPLERLEVELGEGIGSHHPAMPQIQFTAEETASIYQYLHGEGPDAELRRAK